MPSGGTGAPLVVIMVMLLGLSMHQSLVLISSSIVLALYDVNLLFLTWRIKEEKIEEGEE